MSQKRYHGMRYFVVSEEISWTEIFWCLRGDIMGWNITYWCLSGYIMDWDIMWQWQFALSKSGWNTIQWIFGIEKSRWLIFLTKVSSYTLNIFDIWLRFPWDITDKYIEEILLIYLVVKVSLWWCMPAVSESVWMRATAVPMLWKISQPLRF